MVLRHRHWRTEDEFVAARGKRKQRNWYVIGSTAITRPGVWLRVDASGPCRLAYEINAGKIKALAHRDFEGFTFRGRCSDTKEVNNNKRGTVWIAAFPDGD